MFTRIIKKLKQRNKTKKEGDSAKQVAEALVDFMRYAQHEATSTSIDCPYCGLPMLPSSGGTALQCGEKNEPRHPVVQWSPIDNTFQTFSVEIAERLLQKGWVVKREKTCLTTTRNIFELIPPKELG